MALPNTYQRVEYIESNGSQFIDSGYIVNPNTEVDVVFKYNSSYHNSMILGVGSDSSSNNEVVFCIYPGIIDSSGKYYYSFATASSTVGTTDQNSIWKHSSIQVDDTKRRHVLKNQEYKIYNENGTLAETVLSSNYSITKNSNHSMGIFCWRGNDTNSWNYKSSGKLYSCKISENGTLVKNLVPVVRKSDSKPGLYDLVNDVFYTNQGTGEFIYKELPTTGNVKKIYIGDHQIYPEETWEPGANTVAYRPFVSDLKDYSGNNHDFATYTGTTSFVDGMLQTNGKLTTSNLMSSLGNTFTMSMYIVANTGTNAECVFSNTSDRSYINLGFGYGFGNYRLVWDNSGWVGPTYTSSLDGNPHLVTATKNGTDVRLYVDGELKTTSTVTKSIVNATYFMLGNVLSYSLVMKFGRLILENRVRTAEEINKYYKITKRYYGL